MKIFNYDSNGIFIDETNAEESPLEPGVFLIPAKATSISPPAFNDSQVARFVNDVWVIESIPKPAPPNIPTKAELIAAGWSGIKAERDRRKAGGVKVGAKWFHSDDGSRIQQMGLVMMGASVPAGLQWKTMDGSFITMTQALAGNVFAAAAASDQAVFAAAETHRVAMEASADPASYDYSGGWPKIYGE